MGTHITRRARRVLGSVGIAAVAIAVFVVGLAGTPSVGAVPPAVAQPNGPAEFLPAPNPQPYCDSPVYFEPWSKATDAFENGTANGIAVGTSDTAVTSDGSRTAVFTTIRQSASGNGTVNSAGQVVSTEFTPMVGPTNLASIGIVMNGDEGVPGDGAQGRISLFDQTGPAALFYSQWVFTDMDLGAEGFAVAPTFTGENMALAIFGGDDGSGTEAWKFTGPADQASTAEVAYFSTTRGEPTQGWDLKARAQVDFLGPISGFAMERTGNGGSGFLGGGGCLPIGIAKQVSATNQPVWDVDTQSFTTTYELSVVNSLPTTQQLQDKIKAAQTGAGSFVAGEVEGIDITALQVEDVLDGDGKDAIFEKIEVLDLSSEELTVNADYTGMGSSGDDTVMLLEPDVNTLAPGEMATISITVRYTPDLTQREWDTCTYQFFNQAVAMGTASGVRVSDQSDNGSDPNPVSLNDAGTANDPTPVQIGFDCEVGLAKDVGSPTINADGSWTVPYTFTVENTGDAPVLSPSIDDDLKRAFGDDYIGMNEISNSCDGQLLEPGGTCTVVINALVADTGTAEQCYENSADVLALGPGTSSVTDKSTAGTDPDPEGDGAGNNSTPTKVCLAEPGLMIDKKEPSPKEEGPIGEGTVLVYPMTVTNTGDVLLANVLVTDSIIASVTCEANSLQPGESTDCTGEYTVKASDIGKVILNTATATGVDPDGNVLTDDDTVETQVPTSPGLSIDKQFPTTPGTLEEGAVLTYPMVVTNTGDVELTDIAVTDSIIAEVTCEADTLAPGASTNCTGQYTVTADDVGRFILNTATVTGKDPDGNSLTDDDSVGVDVPPSEPGQLAIDKKEPTGTIKEGEVLTYPIVVTNTGAVELTDLKVTDSIIAEVTCEADKLAPQESTNCTGDYTVTAQDVANGYILNTAAATAVDPSGNTLTDNDAVAVDVPKTVPGLDFDKQEPTGTVAAGEVLTYPFVVTNTGAVELTDLEVTDSIIAEVTCEADKLAPGASTNCTGDYTVTAQDVASGFILNTAAATAVDPDGNTLTDNDAVVVDVPASNPALVIDKQDPMASGAVVAGAVLTYPIVVTNGGDVELTELVVTDSIIEEVTCDADKLAPGASTNCTGKYTVTAQDVANGFILNTATAMAKDPNGNTLTDDDSVAIDVTMPVPPTPIPTATPTPTPKLIKPVLPPPPDVKPTPPPKKPPLAVTGASALPASVAAVGLIGLGVTLVTGRNIRRRR